MVIQNIRIIQVCYLQMFPQYLVGNLPFQNLDNHSERLSNQHSHFGFVFFC